MSVIRTRRVVALTAAAAIIGLAASGCASSAAEGSGDGDGGGTLTVGLAAPPSSLDPANMEQSTSPFAQPSYDALIRVAPDGSLEPGLATEWGFVDDENRVFELTVREGVTFSDGAKLDADAVIANLEHLDEGKSNVATLVNGGVYEKVDDLTVRITWETPHPLAAQSLTQTWVAGMMVSPEAIAEDPASLATQTVGAGPYTLDAAETVAGSRYVYKARDDYWDPESQHWDAIVIQVMDNPEQRLNALQAGEIDYAVGDLATAQTAADAGVDVLYAPTIAYGLSLLDRDGELGSPLEDVRVRQAINIALDREGIADSLLGEYGFATEQVMVPSEPGYVDELEGRYAYDPDRARALLEEAGYADGFELPVIASTSDTAATLAQVYVEQLAQVGIEVQLESRPGPEYFELMTSGEYPAAGIGYGSQPLPMEYDGLFGPTAIFNPLGSRSDAIETAYAEAIVSPEAEAVPLYEDITTTLVEEAWFAPVVFAPAFYYAGDAIAPVDVSEARPQAPLTEIAPAE
ncbi:ABC transporter substrate-binding protein [Microbacterium sp. G2-8]|uniref:ABC transporter substrate-binding protein n=1 Tax=Microbacterium sp. G2-8 TaxID=2842454 RepID=UPI001C8A1B5F|nr:ABC transporter substrate-binding protein [Microbacterium sp. G2-8]